MPNHTDRTNMCHFTFADGRRCTMPGFPDDMGLCYYHGQKVRERRDTREAGRQIAEFLDTDVLTATDLSSTLSALFAATVQGYIKPKMAASLTYLANLMLQTQKLAKEEYLDAFEDPWAEIVVQSNTFAPAPAALDEPGNSSNPAPASDPAELVSAENADQSSAATPSAKAL
ncbi:MAG TPA: hypothetical protein VMH31_08175 [Methylomirabilota bacterium]|nr:hypothetical protein [Methylomirabilota bacterium]